MNSIKLPIITVLALASASWAGDGKALAPSKAERERNPLSFLDGALVFDIEERARFEASNNVRDFDDSANDDQDDTWVINRFRLGLTILALTSQRPPSSRGVATPPARP